ncbi:uncharacterized protein LOC107043264 [Diachasma alloeum]|uniref:uncharacterized protein LOC107043264 n=1 Tax=Diachasma alloeum TaxID=454923 RepID=UPI00073824A8|nr:uncharacterized protein LOC107043264 [Diachasma alloeum]
MRMASRVLSRCFTHLERRAATINVRAIHGIALEHNKKNFQNEIKKLFDTSRSFLEVDYNLDCSSRRWKHGKSGKKGRIEAEDDDEDEEDEEMRMLAQGKNNKIITPSTASMRIDAVVKAALGIARNKADVALYESKIRINSEKVLKKGYQVNINDVIDFIVGPSPQNPKFTIVHRITILDAKPNVDTIKLKVLREKNLVIDDYADSYKVESVE